MVLFGRRKIESVPILLTEFFIQLLIFDRINHTNEGNKIRALEDIAVDGSLIQRELGFVPQYDLKTGWEETIREMRDVGYDHIYDVPLLSGSFMFCRTALLRKLRGFDPKYFLYFEDFDLCRRVQETHRTVYNPYSSVIHFWKRASHINLVFTYYFMRSAFLYFNRWGYKFL